MSALEIIVMTSAILIVIAVIASYVYKRIKGIPLDDCGECHNKKKMNKMFSDIRKELDEEKKCGCNCHN